MVNLFESHCIRCGGPFFGPREGGKARGRWLGYTKCPPCRKEDEDASAAKAAS